MKTLEVLHRAGRQLRSISLPYTHSRDSTSNSNARIFTYATRASVDVANELAAGLTAFVMKLHYPDRKERSEIRAVLTVVGVLALGMLAKLDASMQIIHLGH